MSLELLASTMGVRLRRDLHLPPGRWGPYDHDAHTVTLHPSRGPTQYRSTPAHELGHARYRHQGSTTHTEWQASVWAARRLITTDALMDAVYWADTATGVAAILEVMPTDVETYVTAMSHRERRHLQKALAKAKTA